MVGPLQTKKLGYLAQMVHSPEALRLSLCVDTCHPRQSKSALGECAVRVFHQPRLAQGGSIRQNYGMLTVHQHDACIFLN